MKNRRVHQYTTNRFICQKQTDSRKWLILSTYITEITKENAKIGHTKLTKFENNGYFLITPRTDIGTGIGIKHQIQEVLRNSFLSNLV